MGGCEDEPITLSVLQPPLSDASELCFEPARDYVYRDSSIGVMIDACNLLCSNSWIPRTWEKGCNDVEFLRRMEQSLRK